MPFDITITLSDEDLQKFQDSIDKGKLADIDEQSAAAIEDKAAKLIQRAGESDLPQFIYDRILQLQILLNMIRDSEWRLSEAEAHSIRGALYYFVDPEDLIPDHIPSIGFLDDAMYTEIIVQELRTEIKMYQEFCQFRISEETRRKNKGIDPHVGREDWISVKRSVLHARMRERRALATGGRGLRMRIF
ncbi:MAG: YkvA family protein [Pseudohongiellaceae bacterium]